MDGFFLTHYSNIPLTLQRKPLITAKFKLKNTYTTIT
jgi:hypothetical protein